MHNVTLLSSLFRKYLFQSEGVEKSWHRAAEKAGIQLPHPSVLRGYGPFKPDTWRHLVDLEKRPWMSPAQELRLDLGVRDAISGFYVPEIVTTDWTDPDNVTLRIPSARADKTIRPVVVGTALSSDGSLQLVNLCLSGWKVTGTEPRFRGVPPDPYDCFLLLPARPHMLERSPHLAVVLPYQAQPVMADVPLFLSETKLAERLRELFPDSPAQADAMRTIEYVFCNNGKEMTTEERQFRRYVSSFERLRFQTRHTGAWFGWLHKPYVGFDWKLARECTSDGVFAVVGSSIYKTMGYRSCTDSSYRASILFVRRQRADPEGSPVVLFEICTENLQWDCPLFFRSHVGEFWFWEGSQSRFVYHGPRPWDQKLTGSGLPMASSDVQHVLHMVKGEFEKIPSDDMNRLLSHGAVPPFSDRNAMQYLLEHCQLAEKGRRKVLKLYQNRPALHSHYSLICALQVNILVCELIEIGSTGIRESLGVNLAALARVIEASKDYIRHRSATAEGVRGILCLLKFLCEPPDEEGEGLVPRPALVSDFKVFGRTLLLESHAPAEAVVFALGKYGHDFSVYTHQSILAHWYVSGSTLMSAELVLLFAERGYNLNTSTRYARPLLHAAAERGDIRFILRVMPLLDRTQLDATAKDRDGFTIMDYVSQLNKPPSTRWFLMCSEAEVEKLRREIVKVFHRDPSAKKARAAPS
jgi:hypothetical protein